MFFLPPCGACACGPAPLCQLFVDGALVMSDGANEHETNRGVVRKAQGDVLVAGLGIGMICLPIRAAEEDEK